VRSAAELCTVGLNVSSSSAGLTTGQPSANPAAAQDGVSNALGFSKPWLLGRKAAAQEGASNASGGSRVLSSSSTNTFGSNARSSSEGCNNIRAKIDYFNLKAPQDRSARLGSVERRALKPLPLKPSFPPPDSVQNPPQDSQERHYEITASQYETLGDEAHVVERARRAEHLSKVAAEVIAREPASDLVELGSILQAAGQAKDIENIPPWQQLQSQVNICQSQVNICQSIALTIKPSQHPEIIEVVAACKHFQSFASSR